MYQRRVGGLDGYVGVRVRLTDVSIVVLAGSSDDPVWSDQIRNLDASLGMRRFSTFASLVEVAALELGQHGDPMQIAVVGYDFRIKSRAHVAQIEFGAMLRNRLVAEGWAVAEVPPGLLRAFLGCDPGARQGDVERAVAESWGQRFAPAEAAEAYGVAQAARCLREPALYPDRCVETLARVVRGRSSPPPSAQLRSAGMRSG